VPPSNPWNADLSPDDRTVVFNSLYNGSFNLVSLSLDSSATVRELAASPSATETRASFSRDGDWLAFNSDESGRTEVYVRPMARDGGRIAVSTNGGVRPVWGSDRTRLYYWEDSKFVMATLTGDAVPRVVSRQVLFEGRFEADFDVAKDEKRFLMIESRNTGVSLVVVPHWRTELKRLANAR
jgi:Tol biopolymer transport system component